MPIPITKPRVSGAQLAPGLLTNGKPRGRLGATGEPAMEATKENLKRLIDGIRRL